MLTFYEICFGVGVLMSLVTWAGGALHLHLPGRLHLPAGHAPGHARLAMPKHAHAAAPKGSGAEVPHFNFVAAVVFLALFGGSGTLLELRHLPALLTLAIAVASGAAGGSGANSLLRALLRCERPLEYSSPVGVVARVIVPIRERGTGEILFSLDGTRRSLGARSVDGSPIPRDSEVVVMRFDNGLAYVKPFAALLGDTPP